MVQGRIAAKCEGQIIIKVDMDPRLLKTEGPKFPAGAGVAAQAVGLDQTQNGLNAIVIDLCLEWFGHHPALVALYQHDALCIVALDAYGADILFFQ